MISSGALTLGSTTPAGSACAQTPARSSPMRPLEGALTRTHSCADRDAAGAPSSAATRARAAGRCEASTESSRSRISASAGVASARACLRSLSPGTKSQERSAAVAAAGLTPPASSASGPRGGRRRPPRRAGCRRGARTSRCESGRDWLSRLEITLVAACRVSPISTGRGKRTSSQPRLPTVVPWWCHTPRGRPAVEREDAVDNALPERGALDTPSRCRPPGSS